MPFDIIEVRQSVGKPKGPASISLRRYKGLGLPGCHIGLTRDLCRKIDLKKGDRLQVLIGTGEHKGLLRLRRDADKGTCATRPLGTGAFLLSLGYVEQFGTEDHSRRVCDARVLDSDTIELVLPNWDEPDEEDADAEQPRRAMNPNGFNQHTAKAASPPAPNENEIVITLDDDAEAIEFNGRSMEVTARQAQFTAELVDAMPKMATRQAIAKRLWPNGTPKHANDVIGTIAADLEPILADLGLRLKTVGGAGFVLSAAA